MRELEQKYIAETISGVRCYEENGTAYLNLEDVARGLGFIQTQNKNGKDYTSIRWETINRYLSEIGFPNKLGKDDFIPENIFYRLAMKAKNEIAEKFQAKVADEIIPTIRKTGGYVANDELFIDTYFPNMPETERDMLRATMQQIREQNETIKKQREEIEHKEDVIIGLVDDISLADKRQILNRVVRYKGADYKERWRALYREFEQKYHINLNIRIQRYNESHKPKCKSKLDYIDRIMGKIPELYEIAAKIFENDVKALVDEMYSIA